MTLPQPTSPAHAAANAQLHPAFARILNTFAHSPLQAQQLRHRTYESLLQTHHWAHASSADPQERAAAASVLAMLQVLQPEVDPQADLWNFYAPNDYQIDITKP